MLISSVQCDLCNCEVLGGRTEARESHGFARRKNDGEWIDLCRSCNKGRLLLRKDRTAK